MNTGSRGHKKLPKIPELNTIQRSPDEADEYRSENAMQRFDEYKTIRRTIETQDITFLSRTAREQIRLSSQREACARKRCYLYISQCFLGIILLLGSASTLVSFWIVRSRVTDKIQWICSIGEQQTNRSCIGAVATVTVQAEWMSWNDWLQCDKTCGFGRQLRMRTCNSNTDEVDHPDMKTVFQTKPSNARFSSNGSKGNITSTGQAASSDNPSPQDECPGNKTEIRPCNNLPHCPVPTDCSEVSAGQQTGIYRLKPKNSIGFDAYCDQGWTIIMKRFDGSQDFYLNWDNYKKGFGNLAGEHWLGNDNIYHLTNQRNYKIRFEFKYREPKFEGVEYSSFRIENELNRYRLHISGYQGTKGGDAMRHHDKHFFSTKDVDNDNSNWSSCAQLLKGAFWYTFCSHCNPTGLYKPFETSGPDKNCMYYPYISNACSSAFIIKIKPQQKM